jgi:hypothetical protein
MSDGERIETKHEKKCEAKHERKREVENQKTYHDMSFWHNQSTSTQSSCVGSKNHPSDRHGHKTCTQKLPLSAWEFLSSLLSLG